MGVLKFKVHPPERVKALPGLKEGYMTGLDRTPGRSTIQVRPGLVVCQRDHAESGRFHVAWPVPEFGIPVINTATLAERAEPYDLAVELARGRLNDVRNQAADWTQMGLETTSELDARLRESQRWFAHAVTSQADPAEASAASARCLTAAFQASRSLMTSYTEQVIRRRREMAPTLPTHLSCSLPGDPKKWPLPPALAGCLNTGRINCNWGRLAPHEGRLTFDEFDAQLAWCKANRLAVSAGPLLDFRPSALPDWLWLWGGDFDDILSMVEDLVRQVLGRYRSKVGTWHLIHRAGSEEILGLNEEEQVRLTARVIQLARQLAPQAQLVIDFERPWADWLATSSFQLGPLHLADSLARAELGLTGLGLEIAAGYSAPASRLRDDLDLSRLLDQYSLVGLPLSVTFAVPSADRPDARAETNVTLDPDVWPTAPSEALQRDVAARWIALAAAKPYVREVHWAQASDASPHLYPHAGLFRPDGSAKPLVDWMTGFRKDYLNSGR
jgi:hypothetical protein